MKMKVLVLSDSHGEVDAMLRIVRRETPDMIFHLGDCWRDTEPMIEKYPEIPLLRVAGNCDYRIKNHVEQPVTLEGFRFLLCHGHTYGVKQGMREAEQAAKEQQLDAFLFGHTHTPLVAKQGRTLFFNPGSVGLGYPCTYGVITVAPGKLSGHIYKV